jgi:UDP-N-acetylmuramate: L-alanyl-gamma-D-glutamyl-meso-diaminopimelate ligase
MLDMGFCTPSEGFARDAATGAKWTARVAPGGDFSSFEVFEDGRSRGSVEWPLIGAHNVENALAAIAAAQHAGVPAKSAIAALARFGGIRRRLELRGRVAGVTVYDDFAHHPTAIASTLDGLRRRVGKERIVAVLEPRSNTMRMGVHRDTLAPSLEGADEVWFYVPPNLGWELEGAVGPLGARAHFAADIGDLAERLHADLRSGDHVLVMSNGGFGGLHARLLDALAARGRQATRA